MRQDGAIIIASEYGPVREIPTHQCRHCGGHFTVIPGSGRTRGYCHRCDGVTCGAAACHPCRPFQAWLEQVEKRG